VSAGNCQSWRRDLLATYGLLSAKIARSGSLGSREYDLSCGFDPKAAMCWLVKQGPEQATSGLTVDEHR